VSAERTLEGLRVLLVDDCEESRALIAAYLAPAGAALAVAEDARSALAALARKTFDVVLMDLYLPGMDGFSATRALRQAESKAGAPPVPVIALSADTLARTAQLALASGSTEYLAKPIQKADLLAILRRYVRRDAERPTSRLVPASSAAAKALLPRFVAHRERDVGTIREAITRQDYDVIATVAHNMRGNGASYGFPEVSEIGLELEDAARARDEESVEEATAHLEQCVARIREHAGLPASPSSRPASGTHARVEPPSSPGRKTGPF